MYLQAQIKELLTKADPGLLKQREDSTSMVRNIKTKVTIITGIIHQIRGETLISVESIEQNIGEHNQMKTEMIGKCLITEDRDSLSVIVKDKCQRKLIHIDLNTEMLSKTV